MRVTLASTKAGTSSSGSACAPSGTRNSGTPAKSGQNTSATKSTKHEGVRLMCMKMQRRVSRRDVEFGRDEVQARQRVIKRKLLLEGQAAAYGSYSSTTLRGCVQLTLAR